MSLFLFNHFLLGKALLALICMLTQPGAILGEMRHIDKLIIHCTATPAGREVTIAEIDRWHRQNGYSGIGYHFLMHLDGSISRGRSIRQIGAHCKGHNLSSIGIAYVGGLDPSGRPLDTRTERQRKSLREFIDLLLLLFPGSEVHGHNEFAAKACPCFDVKSEWP